MILVYLHLPDYREEHTNPLDVIGLILFGSGVALLSYVLEVFGEHTLSTRAKSSGCLAISMRSAGRLRIACDQNRAPDAAAFAVSHSHVPRGGQSAASSLAWASAAFRFLFPLLYQVGLGFTPIQSGLLMMPQAIAAMSLKVTMPRILARFGYRAVLVSNTVLIGVADFALRHHRQEHAGMADRRWRCSATDFSPRCNTRA